MNEPKKMLRTFIAIDLTEEVRQRITKHIETLKAASPDTQATWEKPGKAHITLKFLGNVEQQRVESIVSALARAASSIGNFSVEIGEAGAFYSRGKPHVLWLGVADQTEGLARLYSAVERELEGLGFPKEKRPFHPHITIARLKKPEGAKQLASEHKALGFEPAKLNVSEVLLIESELGPGGSTYRTLSTQTLG
ncbi:MAG: RNA 2',3'-cyclic phosphodiesterase [Candidatus Udaeobacter sp.]